MRRRRNCFTLIISVLLFCSCSTQRHFSPQHKYSPEELRRDFAIYRGVLEKFHPGLYWYAGKAEMTRYFDEAEDALSDSLTEFQFRKILNYVTAQIDCGHTSVQASKAYVKYVDTLKRRQVFPLALQVWSDTAVLYNSRLPKDSLLPRGAIIRKVDGKPIATLLDSMFRFIPSDGYNLTHKYERISSPSGFGSYYQYAYGTRKRYDIEYTDSTGAIKNVSVPSFLTDADSVKRDSIRPHPPRPSKRVRKQQRRFLMRNLQADTLGTYALMELNTFSNGYRLHRFFKKTFRYLEKNDVKNLVIDLRDNGGGNVSNSTLLTKYMIDHPFRIGDSLYAKSRSGDYGRYIKGQFWNRVFMFFVTRKKADGNYHFRYFERKKFHPKTKNHFDGDVYLLIGGNSFSATTLFTYALMDQENVYTLGEETGGGIYGNSAWLVPDVVLPETKVQFRLPLFRLVINKELPKTGHGIYPEIPVKATVESAKNRVDIVREKAVELIHNK